MIYTIVVLNILEKYVIVYKIMRLVISFCYFLNFDQSHLCMQFYESMNSKF